MHISTEGGTGRCSLKNFAVEDKSGFLKAQIVPGLLC